MKHVCQHLSAPNDSNGNPRQVYVVYSVATGDIVSVYKASSSIQDLPMALMGMTKIMPIKINITTYRTLINWGKV